MFTQKIKGLVQLVRPELALAAGICVIAGQILALDGLPQVRIMGLGFLCGFGLASTANILNDFFDFEVDRVNAPQRPLPSGRVSRGEAVGFSALAGLLGLWAASALGWDVLLVSVVFWLTGFLYNWRFKRTGLPGNLMVSASVAVTFILGAMTVGSAWNPAAWIFGLMAFFIDLGEEIAGDAMDLEGDKHRGSKSIAILKGKTFAVRLATGVWSLVILAGLLPLVMGLYGPGYLVFILANAALILYFSIRLLKSETPADGRRAMRGIYLGATVCVMVFVVGRLLL